MAESVLCRISLIALVGLTVANGLPVVVKNVVASDGAVRLVKVDGMRVVLSAGADQGIRPGMEAKVVRSEIVGGAERQLAIALIRVIAADRSSAEADVVEIGAGWTLESGAEVVFDEPLEPARVAVYPLVVRTRPSGAAVTINGSNQGGSPIEVELQAGSYRVGAVARGFSPGEVTATIPGDGEILLTLTPLVRNPPAGFKPVEASESDVPCISEQQVAEAARLRQHPSKGLRQRDAFAIGHRTGSVQQQRQCLVLGQDAAPDGVQGTGVHGWAAAVERLSARRAWG